jgi:DNA adenine methylase
MGQIKPIIPWLGGKRRLARKILPLFPEHACYVEPFAGGGALFFYKSPTKTEVLNDINGDLINLYRVVKEHLPEFLRQFDGALASRQMFDWLRSTPPHTLTDIQRAARFYYLQKLAFGGKIEAQTFGTATTTPPRLNPDTLGKDLSAANQRFSRTFVECLPWTDCIQRYDRPHTLFYLDPPYFGTEGYGVEFGLEQYDVMAALARSIEGKMLISVNDIPEMRKAFEGLPMERLETTYTVGGGGDKTVRGELLIRNFK